MMVLFNLIFSCEETQETAHVCPLVSPCVPVSFFVIQKNLDFTWSKELSLTEPGTRINLQNNLTTTCLVKPGGVDNESVIRPGGLLSFCDSIVNGHTGPLQAWGLTSCT